MIKKIFPNQRLYYLAIMTTVEHDECFERQLYMASIMGAQSRNITFDRRWWVVSIGETFQWGGCLEQLL